MSNPSNQQGITPNSSMNMMQGYMNMNTNMNMNMNMDMNMMNPKTSILHKPKTPATTTKKITNPKNVNMPKKKKRPTKKNTQSHRSGTAGQPMTKYKNNVTKSTFQNNAIISAAKKAEDELKQARMEAEARKNDAAWTSSECIASSLQYQKQKNGLSKLISEFDIVDNALKANGLIRSRDVTPQAYGCLLEYARRYTLEIYNDALDLAQHRQDDNNDDDKAKHLEDDLQGRDLKAAVDMRGDSNLLSALPPRNEFMSFAEQINKIPLPNIPPDCYNGIVLPPLYSSSQSNDITDQENNLLTERTFDVITASFAKRTFSNTISNPVTSNPINTTTVKTHSSYGANKGPQIPIHIKFNNSDTSNPSMPTTNPGSTNTPSSTNITMPNMSGLSNTMPNQSNTSDISNTNIEPKNNIQTMQSPNNPMNSTTHLNANTVSTGMPNNNAFLSNNPGPT